ncbi:MAG: hypothetical protein LBT00_05265 [Spirochaetaceae bacterium]|jgi:hypothetical protein|nr:hypothetical protein [Spirochaetaceae bacterium]
MTVSFYTLGCKLNQAESDCVAAAFAAAGFDVVPQKGDLRIVNTCTVTGKAEQKMRRIVRLLRVDENAILIVTGCAIKKREVEGRVFYLPAQDKPRLAELPSRLREGPCGEGKMDKGKWIILKGEASPSLRSSPSATPSAGQNQYGFVGAPQASMDGRITEAHRRCAAPRPGSPKQDIEDCRGVPPQRPPSHAVDGLQGDAQYVDAAGYLNPKEAGGTGIRLGVIKKKRGSGDDTAVFIPLHASDNGRAETVMAGDSLRFHRADDSKRATHKAASVDKEGDGVWVSAPEGFDKGDIVYLIQRKAASRRYPPILPKNLDGFRKSPGRDKAPEIDWNTAGKNDAATEKRSEKKSGKKNATAFPEGFYVAVENIADLYIAQSVKTQAVILPFKEKNVQALLGKTALPYRPDQVVISMLPFFPESQAEAAEKDIRRLVERGCTRFIVNNLGQIAPLKQVNAALVAGPYLYAFNRYSAAFLRNAGLSFFVNPFEISRQNLERVFGGKPGAQPDRSETARIKAQRAGVFLTLYVRPKLFQIPANLRETYDFGAFFDKEGGAFRLIDDPRAGMSYAIPETPFSIIDKIPFLKTAGWNRFILDFTPTPLKKPPYKAIMQAAERGSVIPCARFNWKDGFYQAEEASSRGT